MTRSQQHNDGRPSSQQGFTILESLVALLVVSTLLVAISPVIVLSIGVRLQAKRVDSATRAARLYIDGVKSEVINPPEHAVVLNEVSGSDFDPQRGDFAVAATPATGTLICAENTTIHYYCSNEDSDPYSLYCVDGDDDGPPYQCTADSNQDLIIQAFRSTLSSDRDYLLGVRVYRADGFTDDGDLEIIGQQLTASGGVGNRKTPLLQITTEVVKGDPSLVKYCGRLGGCE